MTDSAYRAGYDRIIWKPQPPIDKPAPTPPKRGAFSCPRVITDTMDALQHVDGKYYDSKSAFRAVTKANGLIEMGNDPARLRPQERSKADPKARRDAIGKAMQQVLGS